MVAAALRAARCRGSVVAALAVVATVVAAPAASAAPFTGQGTGLLAFSDGISTPAPAGLEAQLAALAPTLCAGKAPRARSLSLATALAHAQRFVARDAGNRAVSHFLRSPDARRASSALAAAAAAASAGKPTAALAALLRAHALAPRDPTPLIGAAAFLTPAGMPNEALALLAAAKRMHPAKQGPFGVSPLAALENNAGYAELALHAWGAAERTLGVARRSAPLLAEAGRNLAAAQLCHGKRKDAAQTIFFAVRRQRLTGDLLVGASSPTAPKRFASPELFDLSHGETIVLPTILYSADIAGGGALRDSYDALAQDLSDQIDALSSAQGQADGTLFQAEQTMSPATRLRTREIVTAAADALADPDIALLDRQATDLQIQLGDIELASFDQAGYHCDDAEATHAKWLSTMQAYDTAERNVIAATYRRQTALAANLRNSHARDAVLLAAKVMALQQLELIPHQAAFMASYDFGCTGADQSGAAVEQGELGEPAPPACPTGLEGSQLSIDLKLVKLMVDCENLTVTGKIGSGWLGGFARVSHSFRSGETTFFAGPQAGVKKSFLGFGAGATVRDGLYMTVDSSGAAKDFGFRVEHEESAHLPGFPRVSAADGMSFTFVGASPIGSLIGD